MKRAPAEPGALAREYITGPSSDPERLWAGLSLHRSGAASQPSPEPQGPPRHEDEEHDQRRDGGDGVDVDPHGQRIGQQREADDPDADDEERHRQQRGRIAAVTSGTTDATTSPVTSDSNEMPFCARKPESSQVWTDETRSSRPERATSWISAKLQSQ